MEPFYITTTIPYLNGELHLGHAQEFCEADALARYHRSSLGGNKQVFLSVGTDENGEKNLEVAKSKGLSPKDYVDSMLPIVLEVHRAYGIQVDRFIRTSDPAHHQRCQAIWGQLTPYIKKRLYTGSYCVGCEEFKTEIEVKETEGICPDHNRPYEIRKEENYFFQLSKFTEQIKEAIETDLMRILPDSRRNEILSLIEGGLEDQSVSRPKSKLPWGVDAPLPAGSEEHVIHIWFEALMNYITLLGYPEHPDFAKFWPAAVQVLGKGVLRQHAAVWPGILLALNLPLPKNLYVHGYVTINSKKMSKSLGNFIEPRQVVNLFGQDAARYFFLGKASSYNDWDFSWPKMLETYNNDLINGLGNVIQRVATMLQSYLEGQINGLSKDVPGPKHDNNLYHEAMANYRFDKALEWVFDIISGINKYLEQTKPWLVAKNSKDPKNDQHLQEILLACVGELREVGQLIIPFMPGISAQIQDIFGGDKLNPPQAPIFSKVELPAELSESNPA